MYKCLLFTVAIIISVHEHKLRAVKMENMSIGKSEYRKLNQICRTCLINDGNFFDIFHTFDQFTLAQMIQDITNLQINSSDNYTKSVCSVCVDEVQRAHKFRTKCLKSYYSLIKVKTESEYADEVSDVQYAEEKYTEVSIVKKELKDYCSLQDFIKTEDNEDQSWEPDSPAAEINSYKNAENSESDEFKSIKNDLRVETIPNTIFDCPLCHGLFSSNNVYRKHLYTVHSDKIKDVDVNEKRQPLGFIINNKSKNKIYKCAMDDFVANNPTDLKKHIHKHMGDKPITCTDCDFRTTDIGLLKLHKLQKHSEEKKFSCPECNYSCKRKGNLKSHLASHTSEKNFQCSECQMMFKRGSDLSTHKKVKHEQRKSHVCNICQKAFFHSTALKQHMVVHTGKKSHVCHHCGMSFTMSSNLTTHVLLKHSNSNEIFKCSICKYETKLKNRLTAHVKNHFAEKTFQCPHCPHKTHNKSCLREHIMKHFHIEKKFSCEFCDYKCRSAFRLKSHKTIHSEEKPFACNICDYSGKSKRSLRSHLETHNTEIKYICDNCPYKTNIKLLLQRHLKKNCVVKPRGRCPSKPMILPEMQNNVMNSKIEQNIEEPL